MFHVYVFKLNSEKKKNTRQETPPVLKNEKRSESKEGKNSTESEIEQREQDDCNNAAETTKIVLSTVDESNKNSHHTEREIEQCEHDIVTLSNNKE